MYDVRIAHCSWFMVLYCKMLFGQKRPICIWIFFLFFLLLDISYYVGICCLFMVWLRMQNCSLSTSRLMKCKSLFLLNFSIPLFIVRWMVLASDAIFIIWLFVFRSSWKCAVLFHWTVKQRKWTQNIVKRIIFMLFVLIKSRWSSWLLGPKWKFLYIFDAFLKNVMNNLEWTLFLVSIVNNPCGSVKLENSCFFLSMHFQNRGERVTCLCINSIIFRSVDSILHELCDRFKMDTF